MLEIFIPSDSSILSHSSRVKIPHIKKKCLNVKIIWAIMHNWKLGSTPGSVHWKCTPGSVHREVYTEKCTPAGVHREVYTGKCTPGSVHRKRTPEVYIRMCTSGCVHRTVHSTIHCNFNFV